jgi:hypothetical protein
MGLFDFVSDIDTSEDHLWGHGFDRSVCEGCPHNTGGSVPTCDTCGCPLLNLDATDAPPESCVRLERHAADE